MEREREREGQSIGAEFRSRGTSQHRDLTVTGYFLRKKNTYIFLKLQQKDIVVTHVLNLFQVGQTNGVMPRG